VSRTLAVCGSFVLHGFTVLMPFAHRLISKPWDLDGEWWKETVAFVAGPKK
jgi:hypothetical protein